MKLILVLSVGTLCAWPIITRAQSAPSTTSPVVLLDEPGPACAGLEQLPLAGKPVPVLAGRLRLRPPEGSIVEARPVVEGFALSAEEKTRIETTAGETHLRITVDEQLSYWSTGLSDPGATELRGEHLIQLANGIRAYVNVKHFPVRDGGLMIARARIVLLDNTYLKLYMAVNAATAARSAGCSAWAETILKTLEPGERKLDLGGGDRDLGDGIHLQLPPGYVMYTEEQHGLRRHLVNKVGALGFIDLRVGLIPRSVPTPAPMETHPVFGKDVPFVVSTQLLTITVLNARVTVPGVTGREMDISIKTDDARTQREVLGIVASLHAN